MTKLSNWLSCAQHVQFFLPCLAQLNTSNTLISDSIAPITATPALFSRLGRAVRAATHMALLSPFAFTSERARIARTSRTRPLLSLSTWVLLLSSFRRMRSEILFPVYQSLFIIFAEAGYDVLQVQTGLRNGLWAND
ncbi:hypothetical protein M433DRAFT_377522 [Acidomyces richmondensis BFW]|nr:MAG: hypothetical protein FE78DRAFT_288317 [Acidomyces sp. 'richmondensis']KYG48874.1 hypothetical protein M433DRAFT_377522 [Acidomyces richmondensis BFW]